MFSKNLYYINFLFLLVLSLFMFLMGLFLMINNYSVFLEWLLFNGNTMSFIYIIYLDWISLMYCFVVFFISSMVVLYSKIYMGSYNYSSIRFLVLVMLFVFSMFLMVMSPNLVSILVGWDGLGLVSYCLVIYYSSLSSYLSGMITCLVNRLGDLLLLISVGWMLSYGSWNFLFYLDKYSTNLYIYIILSSFTKSAQIPFSMWLPAAMAAPTPVSSLVHSSTLVTAGVYLLIRFFNSTMVLNYFLFISLMTMTMSSFCAIYEYDLKSIIALSTLSQLGLMMSCLFMGLVDLCYFHLLSHAMFKSLLFLCSGIIIHLMGGIQDIRYMGSICLMLPLTSSCFNISNMALCGFPFLSGFYSKDLIIESFSNMGGSIFLMVFFYLSLGLTSFYSLRLFYYTVLMNFKYYSLVSMVESISLMKFSIFILSLFSMFFGSMYMWLVNLDMEFLVLPFYLKLLTLFMVMLGLYFGYVFSYLGVFNFLYYHNLNGSMWFMYSYLNSLYYLNYMSSLEINKIMVWGELYGGMGLSYYLLKFSNFIQFYYLNSIKVFLITMIIWFMLVL
uniref:NADH dehydrogenase subunit 5 n=1 Tax=Eupelix cuspidata TaxID=139504 RepID=UPI002E764D10|nr:NADH dehydrogenase subunit 5 [Eupelix cuspidata]WRK21447.1 NADH dehydrogenase subunit 5 [Eupelix cuspidata]